MDTSQTIRIINPSDELAAFIKDTQQKKKERMKSMRDNFLKAQH